MRTLFFKAFIIGCFLLSSNIFATEISLSFKIPEQDSWPNQELIELTGREFSLPRIEFVTIPEGQLQNGTKTISMASFEASKYPVTQEQWKEIMGRLPEGVQPNCPNCPITHVNWESEDYSLGEVQIFLKRLNQKAALIKPACIYDLPTERQLRYMILGDETGESTAQYAVAKNPETGSLIEITDKNVSEYVTLRNNSNKRIQPVGQKKLNAFGIEIGNVERMSKSRFNSHRPFGRLTVGGGWRSNSIHINSYGLTGCGIGSSDIGFDLVRTCQKPKLKRSRDSSKGSFEPPSKKGKYEDPMTEEEVPQARGFLWRL